jgi:hypothetical protein
MKVFVKAVFAAAMVALSVGTANAATVIDFGSGDAGVGGVFTLLGGGNASGANIPIDALTVSGAPAGNGVYEVTGTCVDGADVNGSGCLNFNTATNTVTITGAIPGLGILSEALLTGSFVSFTADVNGLQGARGPDSKARDLLIALGLSANQPFQYFGFSLTTNGLSPDSVISTDIRNTAVPEPASLTLLGSGLLFLARRRRAKA